MTLQAESRSKRKPREIVVRSRRKIGGEWKTEWTERTQSWKKAWSIVRACGGSREDSYAWSLRDDNDNKHHGTWFLDIGGVEEKRERELRFAEVCARAENVLRDVRKEE